ncbi:aspartate carbamoyltransferase [Dehalococcoides mccartyi]|jgi:aspartate carbamoyltransferase catalytic subunit|uniref:aspartate carbamoyltransferase catalytic subunit n=1 Tax=Dehalococcoides mccartyi TaxID=61435 RepID=UPI0004E057AB|nr:aspartate carbamoyltransferase catalytic subunit [Dehalococcoides mccartyi]AII58154.1 aspartate carbamoyltransferase [Dehalococcoides mccartyi CG1]APH12742.1 aspartate carbamoyltransferase [Dehalococcoides mccartyi]
MTNTPKTPAETETLLSEVRGWKHRHVLDLDNFSREELDMVMQTAGVMLDILSRPVKKVPALKGKTIATLFYEPSTRTRSSFELAAKSLSADVLNLNVSQSSVSKGESLLDTLDTLEALGADMVVMRHPLSGAPYLAANHCRANIINAGDGWHAHPSQALLDIFTILRHKPALEGLKITLIGDIKHSRVAHSNIWGLSKMGAEITLCAPYTLLPEGLNTDSQIFPEVTVKTDIKQAVSGADVVMGLRLQRERQQSGLLPGIREYAQYFQLNAEILKLAKPDALVMHPGPVNEDIELSQSVVHGEQSVINEQVKNGVAIRMALFYLCSGSKEI